MPSTVYGGLDESADLMGSLINNAGITLASLYPWQALRFDATFTGDGSKTDFDLPADFARFVDQTGWSNMMTQPVGIVTAQDWSAGKARVGAGFTVIPVARITGNKLQFFNKPADGEVFTFQYISKAWVIDGDDPQQVKTYCSNPGDTPKFDWLLMMLSVKKLWLEAKQMDSANATNDVNARLTQLLGQDNLAPVLSLNGSVYGQPLISDANLPMVGAA